MKRPTLREGWRTFLVEIAIVVIGVLVALGAQQVVDDWSGSNQVGEFRASVDSEIAFNLYAYRNRLEQSACVQRRMNELEAWLAAWRAGRPYALAAPIGWPAASAIRTSAWAARTDALTGRLPLATRNAYSQIYANLENYLDLARREREPWASLQEFDGATDLDRHDLMRLQGLITQIRRLDHFIVLNFTRMRTRAHALGIQPANDQNSPPPAPWHCTPLRGQA